ncbi:MAG: four helix bundle protein, partial [Prevotella sp.]|nr:four helix bundle protein [Prevotella sp.]
RMHKARTDYRRQQDERLAELERTLPQLQQQLSAAQADAARWKAAYDDLKQRALAAYYRQQDEINALKQQLE